MVYFGLTFKLQKATLQSHDSYFTQKTLEYKLNIRKMTRFWKEAKLAIIQRQNHQKWPALWLNFEDQEYYKKWH